MTIQLVFSQTISTLKLLQNDCSRFNEQHALDGDPKAIQQINFTANLERDGNNRFQISKQVKINSTSQLINGIFKLL